MMPKVSIILPTYSGAPFLARSIVSVLAQQYSDWELVIIDDGLVENAKKLVEKFASEDTRIIILANEKNLGVQRSLNRGLAAARGQFIARIDDDDEWIDADKLAKQVAFLEAHSDYVLVGTNATIVDEKGSVLGTYALPETDAAIRDRLLSKNCFLHPSIMARKSAIEKAGGYDEREETKHIEDYDLWLKLGLLGKFANLPDVAVRLTVHGNSMTGQNRITQAKRVRDIIFRYKNNYPHYIRGYAILSLRIIFLKIIFLFPISKKLLYRIQNLYKNI